MQKCFFSSSLIAHLHFFTLTMFFWVFVFHSLGHLVRSCTIACFLPYCFHSFKFSLLHKFVSLILCHFLAPFVRNCWIVCFLTYCLHSFTSNFTLFPFNNHLSFQSWNIRQKCSSSSLNLKFYYLFILTLFDIKYSCTIHGSPW